MRIAALTLLSTVTTGMTSISLSTKALWSCINIIICQFREDVPHDWTFVSTAHPLSAGPLAHIY